MQLHLLFDLATMQQLKKQNAIERPNSYGHFFVFCTYNESYSFFFRICIFLVCRKFRDTCTYYLESMKNSS